MHGPTEIKYTALYERLSRDDELVGDSSSIQTQKVLLEDYARQHGFLPFEHYTDDGWSGGNFNRPSWQRMIADIESGKIGTVIVKDMSRVGREYLQTGYYTEIYFPQRDVRFIAISNNIDSNDRNSGEIAPFLNIMNEYYLRDCSRKMTQAYRVKGNSGKRLTTTPLYGYKRDPDDKTKWIVDEEAAAVVRRIYELALNHYGTRTIATMLSKERVEAPGHYMAARGINTIHKAENLSPYDWFPYTVRNILSKQEYIGDTVNFRSYKKSYKDKKRLKNDPQNWLIFKNTHEAIIDEETWYAVQQVRNVKRRCNKRHEPNILTGLVFCKDCGKRMYNHHRYCMSGGTQKDYEHYTCSTFANSSSRIEQQCSSHSIGTNPLKQLVLDTIRMMSEYAMNNEEAFRQKVRELCAAKEVSMQKDIQQRLKRMTHRRDEINTLLKKLYESYAFGKIPEEQFDLMMADYMKELSEVKAQIADDEQALSAMREDADRADQFLAVVRRYTVFTELTGEILNAYIERIEVHEKEKSPGSTKQQVDIYFKFIGAFPIPMPEPTSEEIAAEQERIRKAIKQQEYHQRYKAKKTAKVEAQQKAEAQ